MKTILKIKKGKRMKIMPLTMVNAGEPNVIRKVGGKEEARRFLENLGFEIGRAHV